VDPRARLDTNGSENERGRRQRSSPNQKADQVGTEDAQVAQRVGRKNVRQAWHRDQVVVKLVGDRLWCLKPVVEGAESTLGTL